MIYRDRASGVTTETFVAIIVAVSRRLCNCLVINKRSLPRPPCVEYVRTSLMDSFTETTQSCENFVSPTKQLPTLTFRQVVALTSCIESRSPNIIQIINR